jgi:hypothetical protein
MTTALQSSTPPDKRPKSQNAARSRRHSRASAEGHPGHYYHIQVRPSSEFVSFRTQDVGGKGHIQRVAGKRPTGSWATIKWLVAKEDAHLEGEKLVADTAAARSLIKKLGSTPVHTYDDRFSAKPTPRASEAAKTRSGKPRASREPAKKASAARGKK